MQNILTVITEDEVIKIGAIQQYLDELPEKALHLGIRAALALIFFLLGMQVIKLIRKVVRKSLQRGQADTGVTHFLDSFLKAVLYIVLFFLIASGFGLDATSVAAVLGSVGVAISLAVQGSLSNLAGGVLIMLLKPFKVGDYIKEDTKGNEGTVIVIDIFYTKLQTVDNKIIVLPNGTLANSSLTNVTACNERRLDFKIAISYETDLGYAKSVVQKVLDDDRATMKDKERVVYVDELAAGWVNVGVRCWFSMEDYWDGKWRITENIKYALDEAGIVIPCTRIEVYGGQGREVVKAQNIEI